MDIMPTILELCGVEVPETVEGQSLLGRVSDTHGDFRRYSFGRADQSVAVTDGRFVYQWFFTDDLEFLFDRDTDPREEHDLSAAPEHAETTKTLRAALHAWLADKEDEPARGDVVVPQRREHPFDAALVRSGNSWNNRGRH